MAIGRLKLALRFRALGAGSAALLLLGGVGHAAETPDDILKRTSATYAALRSYADAGFVVSEIGVSSKARHTFITYFNRSPRRFIFDFRKESGDRFVIWGDPDAFHTWWKTTEVRTDYPNPNNVNALNLNDFPTAGSATKIPMLLFSTAGVVGALTHFTDAVSDGTETINGRPCYRLLGRTSDMYGASGREVNVRRVTLWIDTQSLLLRQVREEAKTRPGELNRVTTTFEPTANPVLEDGRFKFEPPDSQ